MCAHVITGLCGTARMFTEVKNKRPSLPHTSTNVRILNTAVKMLEYSVFL